MPRAEIIEYAPSSTLSGMGAESESSVSLLSEDLEAELAASALVVGKTASGASSPESADSEGLGKSASVPDSFSGSLLDGASSLPEASSSSKELAGDEAAGALPMMPFASEGSEELSWLSATASILTVSVEKVSSA